MEKVLTFGGVFVRASDPKGLSRWYADHLGLDIEEGWNGATLIGSTSRNSIKCAWDLECISKRHHIFWSSQQSDDDQFCSGKS